MHGHAGLYEFERRTSQVVDERRRDRDALRGATHCRQRDPHVRCGLAQPVVVGARCSVEPGIFRKLGELAGVVPVGGEVGEELDHRGQELDDSATRINELSLVSRE